MFGFTNDKPGTIPGVGLVVEPGEEALFLAVGLEGRFGLLKDGLQQPGEAGIASKSNEVMDIVLLTPTKHAPTTKAGVGAKNETHLGPDLAESFDEHFQDGPCSAGAVGIGWTQQGAKRMAATKNVERQKTVSPVVVIVGSPLLMSVDEVVGGVEIENEFVGRLGVAFDEELDEQVGQAYRAVAVGPLFHAAKSGRTGKRGGLLGRSLEQDVVAKLVVVIEVLVALGEGKDALLELALLGVDDFALVPVIGEEFGGA